MYLRCNVHLTWCNFHLYLSFYQTRLDCRLWSTDGRRQRLRATSSSLHSGSSLHLGDTPQTPGQRSDTCYLVYLNNSKYNTKNSFNWLKCKKKKKELEIYSSFLSQINVYMYISYGIFEKQVMWNAVKNQHCFTKIQILSLQVYCIKTQIRCSKRVVLTSHRH